MEFSFGIFDSFDRGAAEAGQLVRDRLDFAVEAEALGFAHYHVTEHHGTPLSVCPSPNIFLAALSQRTTTMRIGALVYVLPSYQLLRLAEEIASLDQISSGRIDLGVGSGVNPYELEFFGVDSTRAREIYDASLPELLQALRTGELASRAAGGGTVELSILPQHAPYPPVWYASNNTRSAEWAGENGINFVGRWNAGSFVEAADSYWRSWHASTLAPADRINPATTAPLAGVAGTIVIGASHAEAEDRFHAAYGSFGEAATLLWHQNDDARADFIADSRLNAEYGNAIYGTAAEVRDAVVAQVEGSAINYYEAMLAFGDMTATESLQNLRAFAETVMPAVIDVTASRTLEPIG